MADTTLTHPDAETDLTVPDDHADRYTLGGWAVAEPPAPPSKSSK